MSDEFAPAGSWQTPLDVAHAHLGVQEEGGPNRGPMIDVWLRFVNLEPDYAASALGYPWCAAFVSWCCWKGGRPVVKSASVRQLLMKNGDIEVAADSAMPGDVMISLMANGKGHCGLFIKRESGRIVTIDGNSNESGSREGNSVVIKSRPVDYWDRCLRPAIPSK